MKRILTIALAVLMLAMTAFAADDITVTLDGTAIDFADQAPTIVEGRTLVPLRAIFEALGATVEWDQATKTVSSAKDGTSISLTIGSNTLYKNDEAKELDVPAMIINGRTMVPARAIAEAYGVEVAWDASTRTVVLTQPVTKDAAPVIPAEDTFMKYSEAYTTGAEALQTVANPTDASDTAFYIQSNMAETISWTYFWIPATFEPCQRYIVEFDAYLDTDALGNEITDETSSVGVCFAYGDFTENEAGNTTHHGNTIDGKGSRRDIAPRTWTHVTYIFEMPATLNEDSKMDFGIFGNPVTVDGFADKLSISFYLDNITVDIYEGPAENGLQTQETIDAAKDAINIEKFDIEAAKGLVYNLDEEKEEFFISATAYEYANGCLVVTSEGENADPTVTLNDVSKITAEKYNAVAVRFKAEGVVEDQKHITVYFATADSDTLSQDKSVTIKYNKLPVDNQGYYVAYINMATNPSWSGQIVGLRIDPGNSKGLYTIDKIVVVEK